MIRNNEWKIEMDKINREILILNIKLGTNKIVIHCSAEMSTTDSENLKKSNIGRKNYLYG